MLPITNNNLGLTGRARMKTMYFGHVRDGSWSVLLSAIYAGKTMKTCAI
jgi:hypothetical protein